MNEGLRCGFCGARLAPMVGASYGGAGELMRS
jgi:hypothetical protein